MSDYPSTFLTLAIVIPSIITFASLLVWILRPSAGSSSSPSFRPTLSPPVSPPASRPHPNPGREEISQPSPRRHQHPRTRTDIRRQEAIERSRLKVERHLRREWERELEEQRQRQRRHLGSRGQGRERDQEEGARNGDIASDTHISMETHRGDSRITFSRPTATFGVDTNTASSTPIELNSLNPPSASASHGATTPSVSLDVAPSANLDPSTTNPGTSINLDPTPFPEPRSTFSPESTASHDINTPNSTPPCSPTLPQSRDTPAMTPSAFLMDQPDKEADKRSKRGDKLKGNGKGKQR
ncbi:hypothetical protein B0J18DRAFT_425168 [Chaetomium sp. MPI-SDFR-AT-0129]|nr:hypothetical protein B0J18DRAFT_425168 [Chaetomium sp. MPI-SDFR-AT-0129]